MKSETRESGIKRFGIDFNVSFSSQVANGKLDYIIELLEQLSYREENNMIALDNLTLQVKENNTRIGSAIQLLKNLRALLLAAGTDPVKLKELSDSLLAVDTELADAIVANTPEEVPPVVA